MAQPRRPLEIALLAVILLVYAALVIAYAALTPAWQVPDEPAHVNYTRQVAQSGCCPVLEAHDWDPDYLARLTSGGFNPNDLAFLPTVQYEDHQPPLYYLLAAPVYALTDGALTALRLVSAVFGAGVIVAVYAAVRIASGGDGIAALAAASFAAFVPQHVAIMAGAGNDSLAELIVGLGVGGALLLVTTPPEQTRTWLVVALGVVMGAGLITKVSTLLLAPVVVLAIGLRWWRGSARRPVDLARMLALFLLPALLIGGLWWARNVSVYGWPDVFGLARHDAVVVGQPRTADWIADNGFGGWLSDGVRITFNSFWGQFGWMGVPMPDWVYTALLLFTVVSYAGLIPLARRARLDAARRDAVIVLGAVFLLGIAQFIYYNLSFVQFQGRYLYPALTAFAAAFAGGWVGWSGWLAARVKWDALRWLAVGSVAWLALLSGLALWRFVLPSLPAW